MNKYIDRFDCVGIATCVNEDVILTESELYDEEYNDILEFAESENNDFLDEEAKLYFEAETKLFEQNDIGTCIDIIDNYY